MNEDLTALLLGDTTISGLVGAGQRLYWSAVGQGQGGPAAVLHTISSVPDVAMSGPTGLVRSRIQIDCRAMTGADALALARAIEARLSGYRGTVGGTKFGGIFKDGERTEFEKDVEAFHIVSADYLVWSGSAA